MFRNPPRTAIAILVAVLLAVSSAGCKPGSDSSSPGADVGAPAKTQDAAERVLASLTDAQRVGQLLMLGVPSKGLEANSLSILQNNRVGSVILNGNSTLSIEATAALTGKLQNAATAASSAPTPRHGPADQAALRVLRVKLKLGLIK